MTGIPSAGPGCALGRTRANCEVVGSTATLGLEGASAPTQPWMTPTVLAAGLATFGAGAWHSGRRFRRTGL